MHTKKVLISNFSYKFLKLVKLATELLRRLEVQVDVLKVD